MTKDAKQIIFDAQLANNRARAYHDFLERKMKDVALLIKMQLVGENRKQQLIMNLATRRDISNEDLINTLKSHG